MRARPQKRIYWVDRLRTEKPLPIYPLREYVQLELGTLTVPLKVGIRKAAGDTFQLLAEWPIEKLGQPWITTGAGGGPNAVQFIHITVQGGNNYEMLANDKISRIST